MESVMPAVKKSVQLIETNYACDDCGSPVSLYVLVPNAPTYPPTYLHHCSNSECKKKHYLDRTYPFTTHARPLDDNGQPLQLHEGETCLVFESILNDIETLPDSPNKEILTKLAGLVKSMIELNMGRVEFVQAPIEAP